jgi:hypothetical protein
MLNGLETASRSLLNNSGAHSYTLCCDILHKIYSVRFCFGLSVLIARVNGLARIGGSLARAKRQQQDDIQDSAVEGFEGNLRY